jgi:hypothetical protein
VHPLLVDPARRPARVRHASVSAFALLCQPAPTGRLARSFWGMSMAIAPARPARVSTAVRRPRLCRFTPTTGSECPTLGSLFTCLEGKQAWSSRSRSQVMRASSQDPRSALGHPGSPARRHPAGPGRPDLLHPAGPVLGIWPDHQSQPRPRGCLVSWAKPLMSPRREQGRCGLADAWLMRGWSRREAATRFDPGRNSDHRRGGRG